MDFFHHGLYRAHKICDLLFAHYQRRRGLQDHEIIPAHLRQEAMFTEKLADNDLTEHAFMYFAECLKRNSKLPALRAPELNAVEQAQAAHLSHHLITRKCVF